MSETTKRLAEYDEQQIIQKVFNKEEGTLAVGSFVAGKVGHKIERTVIGPTIDDYSYFDNSTLLYTLRVTYNNSDHDDVDSVERTV